MTDRTWHGYDATDIQEAQDRLLVEMANGQPLKTSLLRRVPPYKAAWIVMIAKKADISLEQGNHEELLEVRSHVGPMGWLTDWWKL